MNLYDPAELTQALESRWSLLRWNKQKTTKTQSVHWLYWDGRDKQLVLAFAIYGVGACVYVMMPSGLWVQQNQVRGWTPWDLEMISRNIGVKHSLLYEAVEKMGSFEVGRARNQWNSLYSHTFEELRTKIQAEVPHTLQYHMYKSLKRSRYEHYLMANAFSWEKVYPDVVRRIMWEIELQGRDGKHCIDNVRVAKVGNRQHFHHYMKQKNRGCCGSYDDVITISGAQYHFGFNYGH